MPSLRSVLVEHNARFRCPTVWVGDEAMICLPDTPRDARVTCVLTGPDGESESVEVRRRESGLFADHAAASPIHAEGRHHYRFMVDGRQHRGAFVVRPKRKGRR